MPLICFDQKQRLLLFKNRDYSIYKCSKEREFILDLSYSFVDKDVPIAYVFITKNLTCKILLHNLIKIVQKMCSYLLLLVIFFAQTILFFVHPKP